VSARFSFPVSVQSVAAFVFITLPWLNPFAPGPAPAVVPLLFSWACAAALFGACAPLSPRFPPERLVTAAAWAWLFAGLLSSAMGLCQYLGAGAAFSPWMNQTGLGEAFANLRQRNQFASLTNIALAALLWLGMKGGFAGRRQWLAWVAAGLLAAGNAASSSRTGLLQLFLLCALSWAWGGWRQPWVRRVLLAAVLAYALAVLALPWLAGFELPGHGVLARLRAGDAVCASRLTLWSNVLQLIAQKPWFGWGWGELDYAHYMTLYPGARFCDILDNAHNLPLHLAVELGIPVALLVCGMAAWLVLRARPWRETDPTRQLAWTVLALILLHSMLEYPLWYGPFQIAFVLCVGWLWAAPATSAAVAPQGQNIRPNRAFALYLRASNAIIVIATVAYAAFDYDRVSQIYLAPQARDAALRDDTLNKLRASWLFRDQLRFAELATTPLTPDNAQWTLDTAKALLHFSPEPRVIEKVIESAVMLGRDEEALLHLRRYCAAFAQDHEKWRNANGAGDGPAD
jgi:O-antigen ligase